MGVLLAMHPGWSHSNGCAENLYLLFSGYGGSIIDVNYLMPLDGGMKGHAELEKTGINMSELLTMIKQISEKAKAMLFLDACRRHWPIFKRFSR